MDKIIFKPKLSKLRIGLHLVVIAFVALLISNNTFSIIYIEYYLFFVIILIFVVLFKAFRIKYVIMPSQILIYGIFKKHSIEIRSIEKIQKNYVPLIGGRIFAEGFFGGWYYLPKIGKTWVISGNSKDGVLIITKQHKNYIITPENPLKFIEIIKERRKKF